MIFGTFRSAVTRYTHCGQCNILYIALTTVVSAIFFILHSPQCVYLVNIPEPVQYEIYALALPIDLRCESGTSIIIFIGFSCIQNVFAIKVIQKGCYSLTVLTMSIE